ncbi:transglutaminase family protein [Rathayibacter sp. VKM Ac-2760]|uniref:transglutaminase family protein n=1 Tax=Rathayibacter sp. VKM Ac-2760 TaxID=2609253 RepID=UPI001318AAE3|nr:transglutaminase family protein [Rathayibacter sp. VKM Ac-2760]QHC59851.1 transglutaminase family protein [Rathayibacter sp. VKM Ac-2760]
MSRLRITHTTGFTYRGDVVASYNEARMLPASSDGQLVLSSNLVIRPVTSAHSYTDYWGTRVSSFDVLDPHQELSLTATSLVEIRPKAHPDHPVGWEQLADQVQTRTEYVEQLKQTTRTAPPEDLVALARGLADAAEGPCDAALSIAETIGREMTYRQGVTGVHSTATESWTVREGVCQDITHIVLGALRSAGIPARYVSGYLHPKPNAAIGETVVGESHAWVEWFCGGAWRGYDPTNLIDIGDRHVIVGRGRDYNDIAPLRGVYAGPHSSKLFVRVEITREA